MQQSPNFNDLVMEERPDYKMANKGVEGMTNVDLLSLILGKSDVKTMQQARQLMNICHSNLKELSTKRLQELQVVQGIGLNKSMSILAAVELGRRLFLEKAQERQDLGSATSIYNYMYPRMCDLQVEEFWVLFMNQNYKLLKAERISVGGLTETAVDIRVIMKEALLNNTTIMAVSHNHPSGNNRPSRQDDQLTERIRKACDTMRIYFLDHVIVTNGAYYSYREQGRL